MVGLFWPTQMFSNIFNIILMPNVTLFISSSLELSVLFISIYFYSVLFVVYDELCENSKKSISKLADTAIVIAFFAYFLAGVFGYIAFYDVSIHGNIITNIFDSFMSYVLKFGFIICVLSGFPCD